jgi:RimJ/RimL family protein N-acetyltransferase
MSSTGAVLREVRDSDLGIFYDFQLEPGALEMAAFSPRRKKEDHVAHWKKVLDDETMIARTIILGDAAVGNVVSWLHEGNRIVGYWIGKDHWGKGIATEALAQFVDEIPERPLFAWVAKRNLGSIRVLEKCGFRVSHDPPPSPLDESDDVEEFVYELRV